jgi:AcrR family transcriptional regulator
MAKAAAKKKASSRLADARARMYRDLIFEAAESVFGAKGYEGATMNDIADEAGVSLKTLYATYESKQDLYAHIMRDRATAFYASTRAAMEGDFAPLERLDRGVRAYVAFLFEHESWHRIHLHSRVAWALRPDDEEMAGWWQEGHADYAAVLEEGMQSGVFHEGDAQETALLLQALLQVLVARASQRGDEDPDAVAEAMMVHVRRLLCVKPEAAAAKTARAKGGKR